MSHPMKAYQRVRITTASPGELVVLLLEGLVRYTLKGAEALADKRYMEAGPAVGRAIDIVSALRDALDHGGAPDMSAHLDRTYAAWTQCLARAQAQSDAAALEELAEQMSGLLDGWRQVVASGVGRAEPMAVAR